MLLILKNISKSYYNNIVLNSISWIINENDFWYLIGKSGVGKSVLGKLIVFLERPDEGEIILDGKLLNRLSKREIYELRRSFIYVYQTPNLFDSYTVYENILLPLLYHRLNFEENYFLSLVEFFSISDLLYKYPYELSYSMQKKVSIIRAMIVKPKLLILDEPTSSLDFESSIELTDIIVEMKNKFNITLIIISHDFKNVKRTLKKIAYITDEGTLITSDSKNFPWGILDIE